MTIKYYAIRLSILLTAAGSLVGQNWPEYRGPTREGISNTTGLPLHWSETDNVKWKTAIHDQGWSSPVVYENQVWLTTATEDGKALYVILIDRDTGKILLDRQLFGVDIPRPLGNGVNSYASPSPVIEEGRVFLHFGSYGTACIDTGTFEIIWERRDLPCDHWRGPASSPVIWEDFLFLHMDGADVQYVAALDKNTGKNRWITFRSADYGDLGDDGRPSQSGDWRKAFSTPRVIQFKGKHQLVSPSARAVYGYDPRTGQEIWQARHKGHSSAPRTLYSNGLAGIFTGHIGAISEMWGVRVDGLGDITESHVVWRYRRGVPKRSSPVLVDGRIYMVSNSGVLTCLDFKTGREIWKGRIRGRYSSSIVYAEGRIHLFSEEGVTTILRPGDKFEILARNELDSGFMASAAISDSAFFLRTKTHLYRIEKQEPKETTKGILP